MLYFDSFLRLFDIFNWMYLYIFAAENSCYTYRQIISYKKNQKKIITLYHAIPKTKTPTKLKKKIISVYVAWRKLIFFYFKHSGYETNKQKHWNNQVKKYQCSESNCHEMRILLYFLLVFCSFHQTRISLEFIWRPFCCFQK